MKVKYHYKINQVLHYKMVQYLLIIILEIWMFNDGFAINKKNTAVFINCTLKGISRRYSEDVTPPSVECNC